MLADPARWLWSLQTELELLRTLPHLWRALGAEERIQLEAALLRGPSSDVRGGDGGDPEREEARSRWIWERLARLSRGGAELSAEAAGVLAGIETDHPRWVVREDERDMFPIWVGDAGNEVPGTAAKAEGRQTLSEEELLEALKTRSAERDGRLWESALVHQEDPRRLLRAALQIVREGLAGGGAWTPVLFRFHEAPAEPDVRASLLDVLEALPSEAVSTATEAHAASGAFKALCVATGEDDRARVLGVWDTLYPAAAGIVADDSDDRLSVALNHPAGVLAESLFVVLKSRELRVGEGIPVDVRQRLETLLTAGGGGASTGRTIAASRLSLLWDLDSVWTATHAVPILDWARPEEATAAWQGFLWAPQVRPAMFVAIKAHFLATFDHLARLDRQIESLAGLLASAGLDGRAAMTPVETATALRRLGDKGRGAVAWWLERRLDGAGEKAATLWREQVGPWLEECWPEDLSARGPASAEALGLAVTRSGQAFSDAVRSVLPFLGPLEHAGMILHRLDELGLATREPESCLALLGALTPAEPGPWFGDFGRLLETTRNAKPELEASPAFRRLRDVVARYLA
jgi:hypothetical protein